MSRPVFAFQQVFKSAEVIVFEVGGPGGIELGDPGKEEDIGTCGFEQSDIFFEGNGIFLKVFGVIELSWVNKNAANGDIRLFF
jgi:hypothetical protein